MSGFEEAGLERLRSVMRHHADERGVPALAWLVSVGDRVETGAAGAATPDTIFRIASMSKAVTAVAALVLVEECRLRLDDPVDELLPELADRRVLADPRGSIDDTVPANRPITLRDVLTFTLGLGFDFANWENQPVMDALSEVGLGIGPPRPQGPPSPDEWIKVIGSVPLAHQPGERWLYHMGSDILGVLLARAAGQPLETFLAERVFGPLGMKDTGFSVPAAELGRFGPAYAPDPATGELQLFDPTDGEWATPPTFPSGGGGLVSTLADYFTFADMLRRGGRPLLSRASVAAMTTNQLTDVQLAAGGPDFQGVLGWGFGVGVQLRRNGPARSVGSYGWDGGLGSSWANDPAEDLVAILLTNQAFTSPVPPAVVADFWTSTYAALA